MYESITPESLKTELLKNLKQIGWSTEEGTVADLLSGPIAVELWKRYEQDKAIPSMLYVDETSGAYIDKAAGLFGITRKPGTRATATMTLRGTAGTVIPQNTAFLTLDGVELRLDEAVTLGADGSGSGTITATEVGAAGNVRAGEISRMYVSLSGLTAYSNTSAVGGSDPETDQALVERFYRRLRSPGVSSNIHAYEQWALSVPGVGFVRVDPLWNGAGTVRVLLAGSAGGAVTQELLDQVISVINDPVSGRAIGAEVTVRSAAELPIHVTATLTLTRDADLDEIKTLVTASLSDYLKSTVFQTDTILYNRILALLLTIPGIVDASSLSINGTQRNLTVSPLQVPVVGTILLTKSS